MQLASTLDNPYVHGLQGDDIVYAAQNSAFNRVTIRRVHASGSNDRLITSAAGGWPMQMYHPSASSEFGLDIDAIVWCEPTAGATDCRSSSLRSFDLTSGATTTLGTISTTSTPFFWYAYGYGLTGQPLVMTSVADNGRSDLYLARPGTANSLVRLTTNIP